MQIIADQNLTQFRLPLEAIAADPDADWSDIDSQMVTANCGLDDEEDGEPNDAPEQATTA